MIRTTVPVPVRTGAAIAGVVGVLLLAGCATDTGTATDETTATSTQESTTDSSSSSPSSTSTMEQADSSSSSTYTDGTYTAEGSYQTPESVETISVTLTLEDDVVTAVEVTGDPQARETEQYQSAFIGGIEDEVVGVSLDDLDVSRVAGSSLTSAGFNAAVEDIKTEAAA